jgi:Alpha/beta hydrolase of unknown function (DUF900)
MNAPLLSIQKISSVDAPFPAYLVASTAPINVEDSPINGQTNFSSLINDICHHLKTHKDHAEILIVIHGYNNSQINAQKWLESIYQHLTNHHHKSRSPGFMLIGYRWPSEKVSPRSSEEKEAGGSFANKLQWAKAALPVILGKISGSGSIGLVVGISGLVGSMAAIAWGNLNATTALIISAFIAIFSLTCVAPVFTILIFRLVGYFRDSYRATNFGVSDLVELIRHINQALLQASPGNSHAEQELYWKENRIKLSFIGHSMGAFVVTNTVRILSDVFDPSSVGSIDANSPDKKPSSAIGHVFSLGRLVLVAPDIPAETIISGRANFLQSSLRRFEEAYLFSNEGDMALRLASTAANYFSYPTKTQDGGHRLGNVTIRNSLAPRGAVRRPQSYGMMARLANGQMVSLQNGQEVEMDGVPLDYLYIREQIPLSERQRAIALAPKHQPIGELFTFFDCTDYTENCLDHQKQPKSIGLVSQAKRKQSLNLVDYFFLSIDYFSHKVDTHGGYFSNGAADQKAHPKPEAAFSKLAIYGIAALGFEKFLLELPTEPIFNNYRISFEQILQDIQSKFPHIPQDQQQKKALNQILSSMCRDRGIQVLLAQDRYS